MTLPLEELKAEKMNSSSVAERESSALPAHPIGEGSAGEWRDPFTLPSNQTVLITVEPTEANTTFYGRPGSTKTFPAYIDPDGNICDCGTWKSEQAYSGQYFRTVAWMPLPEPMIHASDCALHNAPAMPVGPCDCGAM